MSILERIISVTVMALFSLGIANAQSTAIGTTWSFTGIGLSFEHMKNDEILLNAGLQLEMSENFLGKPGQLGFSGSFTSNRIFSRTESRNGTEVIFYAGPGVYAGYGRDHSLKNEDRLYGLLFGLQGRLGMNIIYDRNVNISIGIAPVIGMHLTRKDHNLSMKSYRYGLMRMLMPEVGLKYRF